MRARLAWTKVLIQALVQCEEYGSVCRCVFERPYSLCVCCSRKRAGGQTVCFHTRLVDSFTHRCGEHTYMLIRIWALSAASATVHQSNVGIKGELHQSRPERLLFVTCKHSSYIFILCCNEAIGDLLENTALVWKFCLLVSTVEFLALHEVFRIIKRKLLNNGNRRRMLA